MAGHVERPPFEDGTAYQDERFLRLTAHDRRFSEIEFANCTFERCAFARCVFYRCSFTDCRFNVCDLSGVEAPNSRFAGVRFTGSRLTGIDWTVAGDSTLSKLLLSLDFEECVLNYSSFFGMNLAGRTITRCTAHDVDLREADLTGASLTRTDFERALFRATNLSRADLTDATNYDIDPTVNTVSRARFSLPEALSLLRGFDVIVE